jgi:NADH dehydrogenase
LTGIPAKIVTKGYHLFALPAPANRLRVAADWAVNLISRPIAAQVGLVDPAAARLNAEELEGAAGSETAPDGDGHGARRTRPAPRTATT